MNSKTIANQLTELIDADEKECANIEQMIEKHGIIGFFQHLHEAKHLSTECLEKLRAVQVIIDQTLEVSPLSLNGGIEYASPSCE
jgi:ribulose-5-phosphate 4-epimerase/fuculose-1-phosphate aldolase